jgi:hypothetical protein
MIGHTHRIPFKIKWFSVKIALLLSLMRFIQQPSCSASGMYETSLEYTIILTSRYISLKLPKSQKSSVSKFRPSQQVDVDRSIPVFLESGNPARAR